MILEDIYVGFDPSKRMKSIHLFTTKYLEGYRGEVDIYEYPQYQGETTFTTKLFSDMLKFVMAEAGRSYSFFLENAENKEAPKAMICINKDDSIFLGLGVYPKFTAKYEQLLKQDFSSNLILICHHTTPPDNFIEFKRIALGS